MMFDVGELLPTALRLAVALSLEPDVSAATWQIDQSNAEA